MAIKMVREPSETPNISNIDDIIPFRYAYGGQNGYVIGKGTEISNTVNGLNFTVNSGRLVLQGVECDIDATGVTITIDNIATKRYYVIYLEVNLGLNSATIKSEYDTATYPTIDAGDDLTENTTGIARLPLYRFIATSGIISEVNKVVESVKYINNDFIKNVKVDNSVNSDKINGLEIKRDTNGVLKIEDIIIPQKQIVWTGTKTISGSSGIGTINIGNSSLSNNDKFEIEWTYEDISTGFFVAKIRNMGSFVSGSNGFCNMTPVNALDYIENKVISFALKIYAASSAIDIYPTIIDVTLADGERNLTSSQEITISKIYKIIE